VRKRKISQICLNKITNIKTDTFLALKVPHGNHIKQNKNWFEVIDKTPTCPVVRAGMSNWWPD